MVKNVEKELHSIKDCVMKVLEKYPYARDNYQYLYIMVIRECYPEVSKYIKFIPPEVFQQLPSVESVTRAARYIQNELGLYPPSKQTRRRRNEMQDVYRRVYGKGD